MGGVGGECAGCGAPVIGVLFKTPERKEEKKKKHNES
jgi:hypothetical protein